MSVPKITFLLDHHRPAEAEAVAREAIASEPDNPVYLLFLGIALSLQNKPNAAEEAIRSYILREPDDPGGAFWLARCLTDHKRHGEALEVIERSIALDPDDADSHGLRASILFSQGKTKAAIEAAETGLAIEPEHEDCRTWRALLLSREGRHAEADEDSAMLLADDPDSAVNHAARGWTLQLRGECDGAEQHFIEALRIDPENEDARVGLVESLKLRHPLTSVLMRMLMWTERVPWYVLAIFVIGFMRLGRIGAASGNLWIAIASNMLSTAVFGFVLLAMVAQPAFNLILTTHRRGCLALSNEERHALLWASFPLLAALVFFLLWAFGGSKGIPANAIAWCAAAAFAAEIFESARPRARVALGKLAAFITAVAICLPIIHHFLLAPRLVADLKFASDSQQLTDAIKAYLRDRRLMMDYPAVALLLLASFRDNIRDFIERRAGD
ncbi:MAG: tetratricopeptide repeat protein [Akkermansiaceae bacterium]|nr:tetratricopeptide repeat protein [Akkermansiaceae bacterium]